MKRYTIKIPQVNQNRILKDVLGPRREPGKTPVRFQYKPTRMAKIRKTGNISSWRGGGTSVALMHCWWRIKGVICFKRSLTVSQKAKRTPALWPIVVIANTDNRAVVNNKKIDKLWYINATGDHSPSNLKKKKRMTHTCYNMGESQKCYAVSGLLQRVCPCDS